MLPRRHNYQNTMRYLRQRYGMCAKCGNERGANSTKWLCDKCKELKRDYHKTLRLQREQAGLCRECQCPRGENGTKIYCRSCADKVNLQIKQMRSQRVAQGLCRQCKKPLRHRHSVCTPCLADWAEKDRNRNAQQKQVAQTN